MQRIKILQVITRLVEGGAADHVLSLCANFSLLRSINSARDRFDLTLAGNQAAGGYQGKIRDARIKFFPVTSFRREISPFNDLKAFWSLYQCIKKEKFDIVHTHTSKAGILGRLAARLSGVPVIIHTPHGSIYHPTYYSRIPLFFFSLLEKAASRFTDRIIVLSEREKEEYLNYRIAPPDKFLVIRGGIDVEKFIPVPSPAGKVSINITAKKKELGIPADGLVVGNIARLSPEKGHLFCFEAFKRVVETIPNVYLLIVGSGPMEGLIKRRINELNLTEKVIMTGYRSDIPEILPVLDVSVHSSCWEGLPHAMVEAMLAGRPVVATDAGGMREAHIPGETGLIVPVNNPSALAEAMIRLLKDKALAQRMGQSARERAKQMFNLEKMIQKHRELYEELMKL
ncbi:MAG: glycosyltransferase family 4 protein [Planctomycetota bacterium]